MAVQDFFNAVLPNYTIPLRKGAVEILEHEADAKVKCVRWLNADFNHLDHSLSKDFTSFFQKAGAPGVLHHDCDGVIWFELDGKKYMFFTELKSKFRTQDLLKAKMQIVSSFLKTNLILNLSIGYRTEDYIIKGFIIGRAPNREFLVNLHKHSMLSDGEKVKEFELAQKFFIKSSNKKITMRPTDFFCLKELPLGERGIFPKIELFFIPVPDGDNSITLNVEDYI